MSNYLNLSKLNSYKISFELSNIVWNLVLRWSYFEKQTVGRQFVRAVDSISANIAEGFGRYFKKDKIKFYRISLGSLKETEDWVEKALTRKLIDKQSYSKIKKTLNKLPQEIYWLINYTEQKLTI